MKFKPADRSFRAYYKSAYGYARRSKSLSASPINSGINLAAWRGITWPQAHAAFNAIKIALGSDEVYAGN